MRGHTGSDHSAHAWWWFQTCYGYHAEGPRVEKNLLVWRDDPPASNPGFHDPAAGVPTRMVGRQSAPVEPAAPRRRASTSAVDGHREQILVPRARSGEDAVGTGFEQPLAARGAPSHEVGQAAGSRRRSQRLDQKACRPLSTSLSPESSTSQISGFLGPLPSAWWMMRSLFPSNVEKSMP